METALRLLGAILLAPVIICVLVDGYRWFDRWYQDMLFGFENFEDSA